MNRPLMSATGLAILAAAISGCADLASTYLGRESRAAMTETASISDKAGDMEMPFGTPADIAYAAEIWAAMQSDDFVGPDSIVTNSYPGNEPHGELLEIITSDALIDGHEGTLIAKKNYTGDSITSLDVANDPDAYLNSVTIMFQRRPGYDSDNDDWFWAKYAPDGTVMSNPMGMALAGRVARGMDTGCIACHVNAPGSDYVFSHDRLSEAVAQN